MTDHVDDERLLAVAGAISDGRPVDWDQVPQLVSAGTDAGILSELKLLHQLSNALASPRSWDALEIGDVIGQGSFGTVYRGFDCELQREIAVKITDFDSAASYDPERAVLEARMLARIRHPNVVVVFGAQRRDDAVAVSMELVKGETLNQIVERQGRMNASEACLIGLDLCRAVAAVHRAGLLHGDIKAHNVMREEGGRTVLMDFGTGRSLQQVIGPGGDLAGTPIYLAPEVFSGAPRSEASDIYSLGVLLFYLATASYPVEGVTRTEVRRIHSENGPRRRLLDVRPDLPEPFVRVVERAIATDPADRFQTAGDLEAALSATLRRRETPKAWIPVGAAVLLAGAVFATFSVLGDGRGNAVASPPADTPATANAPAPVTGTYRVEASMYRADTAGPRRLHRDEHLTPGDRLFLRVQASVPAYVYVVNEDDRGNSHLLFPLPGSAGGPLPASLNTLPGVQGDKEAYWQVTTRGEREYFVIFASPRRLDDVERLVASLPPARFGATVSRTPAPTDLIGRLRSVGGLVSESSSRARLSSLYTTPLDDKPEDVTGLWARQIAFSNSAR